jgi:uncharacterized protein YjiS (DUF1127 family)
MSEEITVTSYAIRSPQAALLYRLSVVLRATAAVLRATAYRLDGWLAARRLAAAARQYLSEMSERELRDIGLARADIEHVARGGSPRSADDRFNTCTRERILFP